jgi:hypothetical protein
MLTRRGCDASVCHGSFKGGGFFLPNDARALAAVLERVDRAKPTESALITKALARVPHNGGKNLGDDECDTKRLLAWIANAPDAACAPAAPAAAARFTREVAPALVAMGCASAECHGRDNAKLDLSSLPSSAAKALAAVEATGVQSVVAWKTAIVRAALGETPPHRAVAPTSCALRRVYGWVAHAPESTCDLARDEPRARLELGAFGAVVMPTLARRGCIDGSCHGSGAGGMSLFDPARDPHAALHDWLALTARIEDVAHPASTTLMRKVRNEDPHGGGKRIGGAGDCLDAMLVAWTSGKRVAPCPPRKPPPFDRFATEVQPVLDKMTCTQWACHGGALDTFRLVENAQGDALRKNYEATLKEIDLDFMPFSEVMLRMHEECAYEMTAAWIEERPRPTCTLTDPDPAMFPKIARVHAP